MADASPSQGHQAAKSAIFVGGAQVARLLFTTLSTVVVSRLLTPGDYGVVAMAGPVTAFILLFQDLGLSQATVQAREVTARQSSSLFWLNVTASIVLTLTLVAISPLVARFYGDPRAGYITAASAINVLVAGCALQHSALLNRDMRFGRIASIDIANASTSFIFTLAAALVFRSYWALWFGTLAGTIVTATLLWRSSGWRPVWKPSYRGAREMAKFGGNITGFNLINFFVRNADNVLIAKLSGAAQLGLYDRSYKLMMLPLQNINGPLAKVMLPTLRRLRGDPAAYRRAYLTAVRAMMMITFPGIAVSIATSNDVIVLLLGPQWAGAGPIFFWLSLTGLVQPLANATGWLFISSGRAHEQLRWGIFSAIVTLLGFVVGLRYGAEGVAASLFFTAIGRTPFLYYYCTRSSSVGMLDLYRSMCEPLLAAGITVAAVMLLSRYLELSELLIVGLLIAYAVGLACMWVTASGRALIQKLAQLMINAVGGIMTRRAMNAKDA